MTLPLFTLLLACQIMAPNTFQSTIPQKESERISELQDLVRNGEKIEAGKAALELMQIAQKFEKNKTHIEEAISISQDIFLSAAPAKARRSAFAILEKWTPRDSAPQVQTIRINGPHTTCWSRFQDALNARLLGETPWILRAKISNTHQQRNPKALGTVAAIEIVVDKGHTATEVIRALHATGFDVQDWQVLQEVPATRFLRAGQTKE